MFHTIILIGNLGKDPEMRFTPEGQAVTSFSVAVSDGFGDKKSTIWVRVSAWGKLAETTNQYLKRGSKVLVEGRLTADKVTGGPRIYTRQDGTTGASYDMSADLVRFMDSKADAEHEPTVQDLQADGFEPDEIPF